jgi:hypothetical protein
LRGIFVPIPGDLLSGEPSPDPEESEGRSHR